MVQRRTLLKGAGVAGAAGLVGGGLFLGSSSATATAEQNYNEVSVSSDDGTVDYVAIYGDSVVTWDGFDTEAQTFKIVAEGRVKGETDWQTLNDTGTVNLDNDDWGGSGESLSGSGTSGEIRSDIGLDSNGQHDPTTDWHIVGSDPDGYGLPQNRLPASALEVDSDGGQYTFEVQVRNTYAWYDSGGNEIHTESWTSTIPVSVTNEPATTNASSGDGEDGAVAE